MAEKGVKTSGQRLKNEEFEELNILGLNGTEEKIIIGLLELGPTSVSKLSRETMVAHTTIHYAIRKLAGQGLVRRVSRGYRSVWEVVKPEKIQEEMKDALTTLTPYPTVGEIEDKIGVKVSERSDFFIVEGAENMLKTYQWVFLNHRNQRLCGIQTTKSSEAIFKRLNKASIVSLNELVKQNKIIIDAALPESIKHFYAQIIAKDKDLLESIQGRTTAVSLVPDQFLDFSADMMVAKDVAFLANWDQEVLVLIRNADLITLLNHLFEVLKAYGTTFDQNGFISQFN